MTGLTVALPGLGILAIGTAYLWAVSPVPRIVEIPAISQSGKRQAASEPIRPSRQALMDQTWSAILEVESRTGRDPACWTELPTGELGPAQMLRIRVDDVNRILGYKAYTYEDRLDGVKCREMFDVSVGHYWPHGGPEQWARHWNGSPTCGPKSRATLGYWSRVQAAMERLGKR
jgi:hypothetical protein